MTFAQREKQAQERLARHSAKNRQRIEALSKAEQDALTQKAAENRAKLLPTATETTVTIELTMGQLITVLRATHTALKNADTVAQSEQAVSAWQALLNQWNRLPADLRREA